MAATRALVCGTLLLSLFLLQKAMGQSPQAPASTPTFRVTSNLVFLDATVVDKKGHPVTKGLTKDDFLITEDKKPQRIFSFEPPETHLTDAGTASEPPVTIFVLDLLNSTFNDFAYIRHSVRKYLDGQPEQLASPCELMVLRDRSLQMMQGYTRSKTDLLAALEDVQTEVPYKKMNFAFDGERFGQSLDALQQIALQNRGISGRKNIVWVGHGSPSLFSGNFAAPMLSKIDQYVHDTTNMLVDARISLFLIFPGLSANGPPVSVIDLSAHNKIGDDDPFSGDINFGVFVNETGATFSPTETTSTTRSSNPSSWVLHTTR